MSKDFHAVQFRHDPAKRVDHAIVRVENVVGVVLREQLFEPFHSRSIACREKISKFSQLFETVVNEESKSFS